MLFATTQITGVANAQAPKAPAVPVVQPAVQPRPTATKAPIPTKAPEDWIIYDDATYTPVVDNVSRHLDAARKAFDAKDNKKAAAEMRAVADELKLQATRAGKDDRALVKADQALLAADRKAAQGIVQRMNASARKVSSAAAAIESGKIKTKADLDKAIGKAARADLDRRWLITDVTTWYPVSEEPQRQFTDAVAAYARKDYRAAAAAIRKATGYLRLETGRATGAAKQELASSVEQLDTLAASVEKGTLKDEQTMIKAFAKADHALALEHRSKAAESWARKEYDNAGYELKAAAHGLESAAGWVGGEATAGAAATAADASALGDKLASGATWTRDEVVKGFEALENNINAVGQKIGSTKKASPFDVGA
jgi:hypothetical protein